MELLPPQQPVQCCALHLQLGQSCHYWCFGYCWAEHSIKTCFNSPRTSRLGRRHCQGSRSNPNVSFAILLLWGEGLQLLIRAKPPVTEDPDTLNSSVSLGHEGSGKCDPFLLHQTPFTQISSVFQELRGDKECGGKKGKRFANYKELLQSQSHHCLTFYSSIFSSSSCSVSAKTIWQQHILLFNTKSNIIRDH